MIGRKNMNYVFVMKCKVICNERKTHGNFDLKAFKMHCNWAFMILKIKIKKTKHWVPQYKSEK